MDSTEYYKALTLSKKLNIESSTSQPENVIDISSPTKEDSVNLDEFHFPEEKLESEICRVEETNSIDGSKALNKEMLTSNISKNSFGGFVSEEIPCRTADLPSNVQQKLPHHNLDLSTEHLIKEKLNPEAKNEPVGQIKPLIIKQNKPMLSFVMKKIINLPEGYTDSSHSSSSELQSSAVPFESSSSSLENAYKSSRINFQNALLPTPIWKGSDANSFTEVSLLSKPFSSKPSPPHSEVLTTSSTDIITLDDKIEPATIVSQSSCLPLVCDQPIRASEFIGVDLSNEVQINGEVIKKDMDKNLEGTSVEFPVPIPVIPPPTPRKRGRPRKQILPNPSPLLEAWGSNTQQLPQPDTPQEIKRSTRSERRTRKKRFEEIENGKSNEECTPKRRYTLKSPFRRKKSNKKKPVYVPKKRGPKPGKKHAEVENIQNFEEETRMSASEGQGGFSGRSGTLGDESQSSFLTEGHTKSNINKKGRMEVLTDGCKPITVQQIVEYCWPPPSSTSHGEKSESLMIQEQITEYLGVKSFKRKYPSIKRRPVEMEERNYLQENGFVSENMCDMGLTAVFSADIIEIMYNDFPQKFEEYRKYTREKKAKEQRALREKQAAERADMDPLREAIESAQMWNTEFNKTRREKRTSFFDLQTFTVHFPANRHKIISYGKPGNYPIALIPGQNTDYYKRYTSNELKYFPLNTVLYGPLKPNERHFALPNGSDGSHSEIDDDSSSSEESSSSSSEETQDTEETNSTAEEDVVTDTKSEKDIDEKEVIVIKPAKIIPPKTPRGRGRGRIATASVTPVVTPGLNNNQPDPPKKRLGRPPKLKLAAIKLKKLENEEIADLIKEEKLDTFSRVIIHTCKMCHEEESKNKNGEFEGFIECAQCKGKIHPSCIDLTVDMIPKISSYRWQCTDCKSCIKCEQSTNEDKMIFCDQCDRGYHIYCVGLSEVPSGSYICHVCKPEDANFDDGIPSDTGSEVKSEIVEVKTDAEVKTEGEFIQTEKIESII